MEFKLKLKRALEDGILLFVKYGLVLLLIYLGINYISRINQAALNGEQAAIAIKLMQEKGYLPNFGPNGQLPDKVVKDEKTNP